MISYEDRIADFITEMAKSIDVLACTEEKGVYKVKTSKYCIYIYLPNTTRLDCVDDLPIIHLDIDLILSAQRKIVKRLAGLHGLGDRIYARQTVVARIDKKVTLDFLDEHHINIAFPGKYRYGLYYQGELVSIAVFSGGRLMRDLGEGYRSFELIRFCHKGDLLVVGGLSKLLKAFVQDFNPQDIMTYADLDWTQESSLDSVGFEVVDRLEPQVFYILNGERVSRISEDTTNYYSVQNKGSLKLKLIL